MRSCYICFSLSPFVWTVLKCTPGSKSSFPSLLSNSSCRLQCIFKTLVPVKALPCESSFSQREKHTPPHIHTHAWGPVTSWTGGLLCRTTSTVSSYASSMLQQDCTLTWPWPGVGVGTCSKLVSVFLQPFIFFIFTLGPSAPHLSPPHSWLPLRHLDSCAPEKGTYLIYHIYKLHERA